MTKEQHKKDLLEYYKEVALLSDDDLIFLNIL